MAQSNPQTPSNVDAAFDGFGRTLSQVGSGAPMATSSGYDPTAVSFSGQAQTVATDQTDLLKVFYKDALTQSQRSFTLAAASAAVGFAVLIGALLYMIIAGRQADPGAITITTVAGVIVEIISALQFYLYNRTAAQMGNFQARLMRLQRFLVADNICNDLTTDTARDTARAELVHLIATADWDKDVPITPPASVSFSNNAPPVFNNPPANPQQ